MLLECPLLALVVPVAPVVVAVVAAAVIPLFVPLAKHSPIVATLSGSSAGEHPHIQNPAEL